MVLHVRVEGEIDRGTVPLLKRALARAEEVKGECLLISLSTSGGYLDAALECRDLLLDAPVKTVAYVNREALSAGALIAISCDGAMGAAPEKVGLGGAGDLPRRRRGPEAEPGCRRRHGDPDIGIPDLVEEGKLLTLTPSSAAAWGYSGGTAEVLAEGLADVTVEEFAPGFGSEPSPSSLRSPPRGSSLPWGFWGRRLCLREGPLPDPEEGQSR